eukprot:CAMPEP_0119566932 /NCGR_PEP_ID=MMETSP1352-20130426/34502_1 /TAXON_ID=265584 /ORGANISM="Stauroneis constricta, Strain CCMP1120" /LENGTH=118 /DNA_ID=CAMNT_0007616119 /DNA_START=110 /DNA_END=462 /DNA_ORIENTATION=+
MVHPRMTTSTTAWKRRRPMRTCAVLSVVAALVVLVMIQGCLVLMLSRTSSSATGNESTAGQSAMLILGHDASKQRDEATARPMLPPPSWRELTSDELESVRRLAKKYPPIVVEEYKLV